jgi:hypothetical protein
VGFFTTGPQANEKNKNKKLAIADNFFITLPSKMGCFLEAMMKQIIS